MSRLVSKLLNLGIIVKSGETLGALFSLSREASWFSVPPQLRPEVPYDPKRIADYTPNQTRWLPQLPPTPSTAQRSALIELLEHVDRPQRDTRFASRIHAMLMRDLIAPEDLGRVRANAVRVSATSYRPSYSRDQLSGDLGALLWKPNRFKIPLRRASC